MNNLQKEKLVIVINNIDGGTGTYLAQLYHLKEMIPGLHIHTLCINKPQYRKMDISGISFFQEQSLQPEKFSMKFADIRRYFQAAWWIGRELRSHPPQSIISVDIYCNILVALLRLFPTKEKPLLILTTHINLTENLKHRASKVLRVILRYVVSFLYNLADCVISVSDEVTKQHIEYFGIKENKCRTIPNGIHVTGNQRVRSKGNRLVTVSRLVPQKDFSTLISAVESVREKIPEIELIIWGDGPERINIKKQINEKRLNKSIILKGWTQNVMKEFSNVDIFIFSSNREGFGYVIIEAMSQGLPIISTDTPYGPAEILNKGEYGILVSMKDSKAMSDAIISLLTDPEKYAYFSKQSLKRAAFYSEDEMLQAYCSLLQVMNK